MSTPVRSWPSGLHLPDVLLTTELSVLLSSLTCFPGVPSQLSQALCAVGSETYLSDQTHLNTSQ